MSRGEIAPEPWASEMAAAGFLHPRTGVPSLARLAEAAGLGPSTVHRLLTGKGNRSIPDATTVMKLADALGIDPKVVAARLDVKPPAKGWAPPAGMELLESADLAVLEAVAKRLIAQRRKVIAAEAGQLAAAQQ